MERPGFRSFASVPLAGCTWAVLVLATALFISLGWTLLQMGIIVVPLLAMTIAVTVAAIRNRRPDATL